MRSRDVGEGTRAAADAPSQAAVQDAPRTLSEAERAHFADLMERVATARDRAAYAELFGFYGPRVKSYLIRLGADAAAAEEIAQDVMVTLWRKADQFDRTQASVSTWVFRIARNRRIDVFRRSKKPSLPDDEPMILPAAAAEPGARVEAEEIETRVRAAMKDLPVEQLDMLKLAFYEGLSHRDIADKLAMPLGTVKSRLRLAFAKMRERLRDVGGDFGAGGNAGGKGDDQ